MHCNSSTPCHTIGTKVSGAHNTHALLGRAAPSCTGMEQSSQAHMGRSPQDLGASRSSEKESAPPVAFPPQENLVAPIFAGGQRRSARILANAEFAVARC